MARVIRVADQPVTGILVHNKTVSIYVQVNVPDIARPGGGCAQVHCYPTQIVRYNVPLSTLASLPHRQPNFARRHYTPAGMAVEHGGDAAAEARATYPQGKPRLTGG